MYLLDTDTYSNLLRGSESIRQRVSHSPPRTVYLCAITPEEMLRGRLDTINQVRTRQEIRLPKAYDYLVDLVRSLNRTSILRYDDAVQIFRDFPHLHQTRRFPGLPYRRRRSRKWLYSRHFQYRPLHQNRRYL